MQGRKGSVNPVVLRRRGSITKALVRTKLFTLYSINISSFFCSVSLGFSPLIGQKGSPLDCVSISPSCLREVRVRV